jgi:anti-repressor protein
VININELQKVFDYQGKQVRTVIVNDEPWFVAKDVCEVLEIGNPTDAMKRLDEDEVALVSIEGIPGGVPVNAVTESGLYSLVLGSRKPEAKQFKRWVTHEILPAIRKTGSYSAAVPQTLPEALRLAATAIEEKEKAVAQLAAAQPKVLFADSVSASHTTILVGELAKLLKQNGIDIGQNRLFQWMREKGYLINRVGSDYNMPTQRSMNLELFNIKETSVTHADGHISVNKTAKVTGKGQLYFVNKFLSKGRV